MTLLEELRLRLLATPPERTTHDDYHLGPSDAPIETHAATKAAVLLPVIVREAPMLLFTRRTERLAKHSGQVSFPGGRCDPADASPAHTALRETMEETGIEPGFVSVAGYLDRYLTGTGFDIQPVVGVVAAGFVLAPNAMEVAEIFEVPLAFLLDPANRRRETRELAGRRRSFYSIRHGGHEIWGATAAIIVNLAERLQPDSILNPLLEGVNAAPPAVQDALHPQLKAKVLKPHRATIDDLRCYKPGMKIDPAQHAWMTAPETVQVMRLLGEARFVGGAVRNAMLGTAVADIDIAVPLTPQQSQARLEAAGVKVIPTGIDHGTVTAVTGGKIFEITSLRRDVETDGRHAVIAYTGDWAEDAARRDFTINALYAAADGEIFDYATGIEDLIAGRVRFMGDAATRIAEDYLRLLRLFRFHAWYGRGEIDAEGLHAAAAAKAHLDGLSGERIAKELLRLLQAPAPGAVLRVMAATGILSELLPGALQVPRLEKLAEIQLDNFFAADPLLRLTALLPDDATAASQAAVRLKLSNAESARLAAALGDSNTGSDRIVSYLSVREVRKLLYRIGAGAFKDRVLLKWAGSPRSASAIQWRMLLAMADAWERPRFPLTGREVMLAGVPEGPEVGRILGEVEDWWVDCDFAGDEFAIAERLKAIVQAEM